MNQRGRATRPDDETAGAADGKGPQLIANTSRLPFLAISLAATLVVGCELDLTGGRFRVTSVTVSPVSSTIEIGATVELTATVRDAVDQVVYDRPVGWSSNNTDVATASSGRLFSVWSRRRVVTGIAEGIALIIATCEGQSDTATVEVTAAP